MQVTQDGLAAQMTVTPPGDEGVPVTVSEAMATLQKAGVRYGVDADRVAELVEQAAALPPEAEGCTATVAHGKKPVPGQDAVILYHDLLQLPSGIPRVRADGSVDHFQLNLVHNVAAGTVLATRIPATAEEPGMTVRGRTLHAPSGAERTLRGGKGCHMTPDALTIVSDIEGHAVLLHNGSITVSPIYVVHGDVDASTGNVDFLGTVIVRGNVKQGYVVRAGQDLQVEGGIHGGNVEAGGNISVRFGIQGGSGVRVVAGGDIRCRFIENACVRCKGDVLASDGILHSDVQACGKVLVNEWRGKIVGGRIRAADEITCSVLGSDRFTATVVEVGIPPLTRLEYERTCRALIEAEESLEKAKQLVALLRKAYAQESMVHGLAPDKRVILVKAICSEEYYEAEKADLINQKAALEAEMAEVKSGRVRATKVVHPGVAVTVGTVRLEIKDEYRRVSFVLSDENQISITPV